jgi:dTDP-4-amino-4,6-dideoxygalactose transaminase
MKAESMRETILPYCRPMISSSAIAEVVDTLKSDWITTGPKTKAFEIQFGETIGAPGGSSVMLNSCTAGLHLSLLLHRIGPGDEVILPVMTFAATANVIEHVGARPVFVDVEPDTLCIDPEKIRKAVTSKTRAILPVHYSGHPADLDAIDDIAEEHGLHVIEDAAHALPAWHKGKMIGSRPNLTVFSFYATKNMTTGEGGALTGAPDLLDQATILSLHGMSRDAWMRMDRKGTWRYDILKPGYKYNMTDIQASLGMHQIKELPQFYARRREIYDRYNEAFISVPALQIPYESKNVTSSCHLYILRFHPSQLRCDQDDFIEAMKIFNICVSVHFIPLHLMSFYARKYRLKPDDFPVAYDASRRMISLPLYPLMTDQDVEDVIDAVTAIACRRQL